MSAHRGLRAAALVSLIALASAPLGASDAGARDEIGIAVHHAYGTTDRFLVEGRVAETHGGREARPSDSWLRNLWRTLRSLRVEEERGTPLLLTFASRTWELSADDEGYFALRGPTPPRTPPGWHSVRVQVAGDDARVDAPLLVAPDGESLGIVSDVDDTVVVSEVLDRSRLLSHTLLENHHQRRPVEGMAALYRGIVARNALPEAALVIYLTAAPRQLLPGIRAFLELNGFPPGPVVAKKLTDGDGDDPLLDQERYKLQRLEGILADFPDTRFVLVGDDGERDPEVYRTIRERHPDRIAAVFIRRVSTDPARATYDGQGAPPAAAETGGATP